MGVDLGGGNVAVAEQFLDGANVIAVFQHVRPEAVAQPMARRGFRYARLPHGC